MSLFQQQPKTRLSRLEEFLECLTARALAAAALSIQRNWRRLRRRLPEPLGSLCDRFLDFLSRRDPRFRRSMAVSGALHLICLLVFSFVPLLSQEARFEPAPLVRAAAQN